MCRSNAIFCPLLQSRVRSRYFQWKTVKTPNFSAVTLTGETFRTLKWREEQRLIYKYMKMCFCTTYIKPAHLLPGKSAWIMISHFSNSLTFAANRPLELAWLCRLLVYEQHFLFCPAASASMCSTPSQGPTTIRMTRPLHPPELKPTSPVLRHSSARLGEDLSKLCWNVKIN